MGSRVSPFPFGVLCQESFVGGFGRSGIAGSSKRSLDAKVSWFYLYIICFSIGLWYGQIMRMQGGKSYGGRSCKECSIGLDFLAFSSSLLFSLLYITILVILFHRTCHICLQ